MNEFFFSDNVLKYATIYVSNRPYWIQSYKETFSPFKHMGLWEYCFENYRYPYYQFPHLFHGCHHIFSQEYYVIREWLIPGWLMVVQTFVTLALMLSFSAQTLAALTLIRWPLKFVLRYEWLLTSLCFLFNATASKDSTSIVVFICSAQFSFILNIASDFRCLPIPSRQHLWRPVLATGLARVPQLQLPLLVIWICCHFLLLPRFCSLCSLLCKYSVQYFSSY